MESGWGDVTGSSYLAQAVDYESRPDANTKKGNHGCARFDKASVTMSPPPGVRVKKIRSPRGAKVTEIDFADGHVGVYPHAVLRGYCPCAGCQGHQGTVRFIEPVGDRQTELERIEPVGNYALNLVWFDGHSTGIYSYAYLRSLCQCAECGHHP